MKDKIFPLLSVLFLIAVIGVMSWRDMNPEANSSKPEELSSFVYYADTGITPAMVPDDDNPITIALGTFRYTPDGKTEWISQSMPPAIFAQRQVNLLLRFDDLPKNPQETLEKIQSLRTAWEQQGNTVATIFLDYRPETPDFKSYAAFLDAVYDHFKLTNGLGIVADISWLDAPHRDLIQPLQKNILLFQVDLPHPNIPPEIFSELEAFGHAFLIRFPADIRPADFDMRNYEKLYSLVGIVLTLDLRKPWLRKKERIGILPQTLSKNQD